jgi:aspartyl-tRNA(Asn)/glutamyl-tRNA(Gln) amidotransferase subunit C
VLSYPWSLFFKSAIGNRKSAIDERKFTMPIRESDIAKVAQLAHLELPEEELKIFGPQIAEIVNYVEQLNELDTASVAPATGGLTPEGERTDSARDDETAPSLGQKTALAEAPDAAAGHFRVPKVL